MQVASSGPDRQQPQYQPAGAPYHAPGTPPYPPPPYGGYGAAQYPPPPQGYYGPYPGASAPAPYLGPLATKQPSVWPVVIVTLLVGIFGVIPAALRSAKAKAMGASVGRYWWTFGGIMAGWVLLSVVLAAGVASQQASTVMDAHRLQLDIVQNGDFTDGLGNPAKPTDAICVKASATDTGAGSYQCMVDFADKTRQSFTVTVSQDGSWVTN
jgi:hypothetical protein